MLVCSNLWIEVKPLAVINNKSMSSFVSLYTSKLFFLIASLQRQTIASFQLNRRVNSWIFKGTSILFKWLDGWIYQHGLLIATRTLDQTVFRRVRHQNRCIIKQVLHLPCLPFDMCAVKCLNPEPYFLCLATHLLSVSLGDSANKKDVIITCLLFLLFSLSFFFLSTLYIDDTLLKVYEKREQQREIHLSLVTA